MRARSWCLVTVSVLGSVVVCVSGCSSLEDFQGDFQGNVLGAAECEPGPACSFIRRGFNGATKLQLDAFDPSVRAFDGTTTPPTTPGLLTTLDDVCGEDGRTFIDEPLRPIAALAHDQLSQMELPGAGRLKNLMYAVEPTRGPLARRGALVIVSLLDSDEVEVRIVAGDGAIDCVTTPDPCASRARGECDFFGVFRLKRN